MTSKAKAINEKIYKEIYSIKRLTKENNFLLKKYGFNQGLKLKSLSQSYDIDGQRCNESYSYKSFNNFSENIQDLGPCDLKIKINRITGK